MKPSLRGQLRQFFEANPDEALSAQDVSDKYDCDMEAAGAVMRHLVSEGAINEECYIRERKRRPPSGKPFPANLSDMERRAIVAYSELGSMKAVGRDLGISPFTAADVLQAARRKAGVHESVVLVARYLKATLVPA